MALLKNKSSFSFSSMFYLLIIPLLLAWALIIVFEVYSSRSLSLSGLVSDLAWQVAIKDETKQSRPFRLTTKRYTKQTPSDKLATMKQTSMLAGISGKSEVISDEIPIVRYKGAVIAAGDELDITSFDGNVSVGDIVRIVSSDGKVLFFKVIKQDKVTHSDECSNLDAPKKDTTLFDCMVKKRAEQSNTFMIELVPAPTPHSFRKRNAIMRQQL